jgi:BASS family bile acid:Na+ symporter
MTRLSVSQVLHGAQRSLLWLLLGCYALATVLPGPGIRIRDAPVGSLPWPGGMGVPLSLPLLMLAYLLFSAGLSAQVQELRHLVRRPALLVTGLAANATLPLAFTFAFSLLAVGWHHEDELENILVGLAVIGAMPIAGSSTAWSQNAGGNLALSLGLVLASTLLSPLLTPVGLHLVGYMAKGDYAEDLHELAQRGSSAFLIMAVIVPSLLGILVKGLLGARRVAAVLPVLKLLNLVDLLVLNYTNAALSLPQVFEHPDWALLSISIMVTSALCVCAFALGALLARLQKADTCDRLALMFGLGMSNNGTGLVLASTSMALADHPKVMLPIIFYNLVQQIVAGVVDARSRRAPPPGALPGMGEGRGCMRAETSRRLLPRICGRLRPLDLQPTREQLCAAHQPNCHPARSNLHPEQVGHAISVHVGAVSQSPAGVWRPLDLRALREHLNARHQPHRKPARAGVQPDQVGHAVEVVVAAAREAPAVAWSFDLGTLHAHFHAVHRPHRKPVPRGVEPDDVRHAVGVEVGGGEDTPAITRRPRDLGARREQVRALHQPHCKPVRRGVVPERVPQAIAVEIALAGHVPAGTRRPWDLGASCEYRGTPHQPHTEPPLRGVAPEHVAQAVAVEVSYVRERPPLAGPGDLGPLQARPRTAHQQHGEAVLRCAEPDDVAEAVSVEIRAIDLPVIAARSLHRDAQWCRVCDRSATRGDRSREARRRGRPVDRRCRLLRGGPGRLVLPAAGGNEGGHRESQRAGTPEVDPPA